MSRYDIHSILKETHSRLPMQKGKPVIGITSNHEGIDATLRDVYSLQVVRAGGVPLIIPPVADDAVILSTLERVDGILLTGGADFNPLWLGEQPSPLLHHINAARDKAELMLTQLAANRQIPILGICRGMQTLAVALGGHVAQDLSLAATVSPVRDDGLGEPKWEERIKHSQEADRNEASHTVRFCEWSALRQLYGKDVIAVNSFHHQVVDNPGPAFAASAYSPDGLIEAMEAKGEKAMMGVQWHPECLEDDGLPIFRWLVDKAQEYHRAVTIHNEYLILDTHCDTPMFFHQGIDLAQRDPRILVDIHKMTEGRLDATFMVCYLPQPWTESNGAPEARKGKSFADLVHYKINSPKEYADFIFDEIYSMVERMPDHAAVARNEVEMWQNKLNGRKSIILGIENGLAIEGSLENLQHFADRGMTYMTLCHNGDNDICDSAKGNNTHGGVSVFGEAVIKEMNRLGVMVDLSHAGEKSFYDALQISTKPIVCSHSNCRDLCDHPRNLTDEQMRALARCGGVAHTTLYPGFLRSAGEADIRDAVKHLMHAVDVMGIDHVGIGTDFDGDGGVTGMADASEVINFTKQLLRRRFSDEAIGKIWGENWLRVMNQNQIWKP